MATAKTLINSEGSDEDESEHGVEDRGVFESFGWVYHLGVNSIGHEYCHLRFLFLRGKYVEMYKRDPHDFPGIKPIRKGVVGHTLMVEELGRRKAAHGIACATAGEARKWMEAFDQAKQQAEYELSRGGSSMLKLSVENELNLGHQPRMKRYAHGLRKLIRIGQVQRRKKVPIHPCHKSSGVETDFVIDVDIGSSSVARSIISLVLGYVTSIVVDLAILIEAKEEAIHSCSCIILVLIIFFGYIIGI